MALQEIVEVESRRPGRIPVGGHFLVNMDQFSPQIWQDRT